MRHQGGYWSKFSITVRENGAVSILDLDGPLGIGESRAELGLRIDELLAAGARKIAINLSKVPFVDSTGVGALVNAHTAVEAAGGKCKVFAVHPHVTKVLAVTRVDRVLDVVRDEEAAVAGF
jgi:anti-anti-sigma factor